MRKVLLQILLLLFAASAALAKQQMNYYADMAEKALASQQYNDALGYARQEIADYEKNPQGYWQAAVSLYALDRKSEALAMLDKAIKHAKKNKPLTVDCALAKSQIFEEMGDTVQAIKALSTGLKADSKNKDLLLQRAWLQANTDMKKALKDLEKAKKLYPGDPAPYVYTARIYYNQNNLSVALAEINSAIERDNTSAYNYIFRANAEKQLGHTNDFIKDCLNAIKYGQENDKRVSIYMLELCDTDEMRNEIIAEIEKVRTPSNGYYQLEADLLYNWELYASARSIYEEIINLGIDDADTYCKLAECQEILDGDLEAYTTVSKGLDKYGKDTGLKYIKASIATNLGKCDDALDILNSLITESPETSELYCEKGRAYLTMGKYAEACKPLATAVALEPSAINKKHYGDALRLSGNVEKANAQYNDILKMSEDDITKQGTNPQRLYAMAYSGLGNRTAAINALYDDQKDIDSDLALVYARLGDNRAAIKSLKEAWKNNPKIGSLNILYDYDFYWLHTDPDFAKLLAEHGIKTELNPETKLLEYVPESWYQSMGGRSLEELEALKASSPQDWVKKMNALCPIDYGSVGLLVSVGYNEKTKTYIYNYTAADEYGRQLYELSKDPKHKEIAIDKLGLNKLLSSRNGVIRDVNYGIRSQYNYETADGNNKCSFTLTPKKLKQLLNECRTEDDVDIKSIEILIDMGNATVPDVITSLEEKWLIHTYTIPEDDGAFYNIELRQDLIRKQEEQYMSADPAFKALARILVRQGIGEKIIYRGDKSGKTVEIVFTPEELNTLINK